MANSHKFGNVGGYRYGSGQYSPLSGSGGWLAADVKSRVSDLASAEQAEFGSNRSPRILAYITGLEQPLTYEVLYGDPSPGLRR